MSRDIRRGVKAIDYLKSLPRSWLPKSNVPPHQEPSNSELYRWLQSQSVVINGKTPMPFEEITFPITELIFFPHGTRRTTLCKV